MSETTFSVEYAKSSRASCRGKDCKNHIEKGALRFGKHYQDNRINHEVSEWYHPECLLAQQKNARKNTKVIETEDDIKGYLGILETDQQRIKQFIRESKAPGSNTTSTSSVKSPVKRKPLTSDKSNVTSSMSGNSSNKTIGQSSTNGSKPNTKSVVRCVLHSEDHDKITLKDGPFVLGRSYLLVSDRKCSRKQVELNLSNEKQKVTLLFVGKNPMFLFKKEKNTCLRLQKGDVYHLSDGDAFSLFLNNTIFRVELSEISPDVPQPEKKQDLPVTSTTAPATTTTTTTTSSTTSEKKRSLQSSTDPKKRVKTEVKKETEDIPEKFHDVPKAKKGYKSDTEDDDDGEPNEYDLNSSFIDDVKMATSPANRMDRTLSASDDEDGDDENMTDEDLDEVISEGRNYAKHVPIRNAAGGRAQQGQRQGQGQGSKQGGKPTCQYGASCYRKNPNHLKEFYHPPS
eukprot:TRINITY_DN810_c0_g1_i1.p1 TRINITY_DN810_c0_g1~~TRINITY_DN810_c0_g1_i1.p1  ORF type:complete len:474 (-),score=117.05 TRINITY_DN810_c0_g1_i1:8-1378(-)